MQDDTRKVSRYRLSFYKHPKNGQNHRKWQHFMQ